MRHVSIEDQGRCGTVTYHEAGKRLACYWEFGGWDAVAFVQCGNAADWARHPWALQQILPGTDATAFVGTSPPVPDKVSEPLLVIIEHDSGRQVTHSLWQ